MICEKLGKVSRLSAMSGAIHVLTDLKYDYMVPMGLRLLIGQGRNYSQLAFVPKYEPPKPDDLTKLSNFIKNSGRLCVLTGAGVSTESGIPDYRSQGVGLYATSNKRPVLYQDFRNKEPIRRRYWARNYIGWPRFSNVQPNGTHKILKHLEDLGIVNCIVTQNVDGLHSKAGSKNVIELHGTAFRVMCLSCDKTINRHDFQKVLDKANPSVTLVSKAIRPDGDVELSEEQIEGFILPPCQNCGGVLKPDIVFFGDNVPRVVVETVQTSVDNADALLVLGTSLTTFSGYRIILQAVEANKPIAIVNIGETRADSYANVKIESRCGEVFSKVFPSSNFGKGS
ncbi:NAD-dependent protein deacylase Sirt4 [Diachasma alloeum]|uniref:NAD-dependent protein deacylase Sirt4 n=1 Tax=Diachasma alloeum TaxID=454923 RepID=UPI0007380FCF|nr:NAD-dependent protein deacylase Sirt4 [Diachasma alloeum]XP_028981944.1 NAD-dependent protein deacylase Sirt4 [Diachasma alloeum]XP_028981945.1 NAD-dependent protein deacylase Sirt4 [Diachasma alloeum]